MVTTLIYSMLALDSTVATLAAQYGAWVYAILFVIIFAETGLVVCPFLPGDSILFIAGTVVAVANLNDHVLVVAKKLPQTETRGGVLLAVDGQPDGTVARKRFWRGNFLFATEREQEAVGELATRWVLKRGARGLTADGIDHPAVDVDVVDSTGAGDALAAGFLVGGPKLAVATAARCCVRMGSMP